MLRIVVSTEGGEVLDTFCVGVAASGDTQRIPFARIKWTENGPERVENEIRKGFELVGNPWVDAKLIHRLRTHAEDHTIPYADGSR